MFAEMCMKGDLGEKLRDEKALCQRCLWVYPFN
jgi:hypothetical protein